MHFGSKPILKVYGNIIIESYDGNKVAEFCYNYLLFNCNHTEKENDKNKDKLFKGIIKPFKSELGRAFRKLYINKEVEKFDNDLIKLTNKFYKKEVELYKNNVAKLKKEIERSKIGYSGKEVLINKKSLKYKHYTIKIVEDLIFKKDV